MLVQKVPRHFRGCGILPRQSGWRAGGKSSRGAAETRRAWRTLLHKRTKRKQKGRLESGRNANMETMKTALRTWKEGGKWMCSRDADVPPAGRIADWRMEITGGNPDGKSNPAWHGTPASARGPPPRFQPSRSCAHPVPPPVLKRFPPFGTHPPATRSGAIRLSMKKNVDKTVVRD